jgi:hypothetical protein
LKLAEIIARFDMRASKIEARWLLPNHLKSKLDGI